MKTAINRLPLGTRFRLAAIPELTGTLAGLSPCSATVRLDGRTEEVEITTRTGQTVHFVRHRQTVETWALDALVEVLA